MAIKTVGCKHGTISQVFEDAAAETDVYAKTTCKDANCDKNPNCVCDASIGKACMLHVDLDAIILSGAFND